ncbi:MAG TPA: type II toxin-antitoxin system HicB family antitoxin [Solirubrobacterales bacterium]|nr:type II toxin-antitoxin system HicB family antitoxin [Solirubrobacterales bacterium]
MTEYRVVFEPADDGSWSAYSIDLPGVFAAGRDRAEVEVAMREALALHRDELRRRDEEPDGPRSQVAVVAI